jgi:hypothetical protein
MLSILRKLKKNEQGATAIEYVLVADRLADLGRRYYFDDHRRPQSEQRAEPNAMN